MKRCSKCKCDKPLSEFAWRSKTRNILHGQCNECRRVTAQQSYIKNKENIKLAVKIRKKLYKDKSSKWKSRLSCVICDEDYIKCLDFHHIDAHTKEFDISGMTSRYPLTTILKEVEKCIVVCSNCHRKIHGGLIVITNELIEKSKLMITLDNRLE